MKAKNESQSNSFAKPSISIVLPRSIQPNPNSSVLLTSLQSPTHSSQSPNRKPQSLIHQLYSQIHTTINDMDSKVEHVIKKHQSQFLFAYRTHIKKIRKELAEIKYKSEEQEKMFSSNDRIQYLEKELAIFRQQTMKLYNKIDQKNHQLDLCKNKLKDALKQSTHDQSQLKQQIKRNKFDQRDRAILTQRVQSMQKQIIEKDQLIKKLQSQLLPNSKASISSNYSPTKLYLKKQQSQKTSPVSPSRKSPIQSMMTSMHFNQNLIQNPRVYEHDLKDWFLECIKTVKRQIAQRNNHQATLDLNMISSIDQFMMIDKLRLLQVFLQNQKLLTHMYQRIFPDRLTNLRQKLSKTQFKMYSQLKLHQQISPKDIFLQRQVRATSINQENLNDRYRTQSKMILPKVSRVSEHKPMFKEKSQWRGSLILKDGKLNISIN